MNDTDSDRAVAGFFTDCVDAVADQVHEDLFHPVGVGKCLRSVGVEVGDDLDVVNPALIVTKIEDLL